MQVPKPVVQSARLSLHEFEGSLAHEPPEFNLTQYGPGCVPMISDYVLEDISGIICT